MIPIVLVRGVEPVTAAKPLGAGRNHAFRLLPQLDPGDVFSARVEAKLPDGSFKVMLAGQAMRMSLPANVTPGDTLSLTFVSHEPRPTFALRDAPRPAFQPTLLSAAGRLVATLRPGDTTSPLLASAAAPLLAAPPAEGARLSTALAQMLANSGLFYESHLAQWVAGERTLAQIRREPQARLTPAALERPGARTAEPSTDASASASTSAPAREQPKGPPGEHTPLQMSSERKSPVARQAPEPPSEQATGRATEGNAPSAAPARAPEQLIDPRAAPLVQQQLAALDDSRVLLQFEIWPGQWMEWEIEGDPPEPDSDADTVQLWSTRLRLDLPRLGKLEATLSLTGESVRVRLQSASETSSKLLGGSLAGLQAALAAAGLPPSTITVAHHETI